jgi:alpha-1,4-digalacturonate transport system permease protein
VIRKLIFARRNGLRWHWTDIVSYAYLVLGVVLMFGPVVWLALSSFKSESGLLEFPPAILPTSQVEVRVAGFDNPLPLYRVARPDGSSAVLAQARRIGIEATMVDPKNPAAVERVPLEAREPVREFALAWDNYTEPLKQFHFLSYFWNSVFVTTVATLITLVINSMAAYALAIYEFRGRGTIMALVLGTLMIPITVLLVPVYLAVSKLGLVNSLWGVILPGAATPTGVFLLRQYMLTLPRDLIEAARMDRASEWKIYARIVIPLSLPALAVLAIFSVMWRWNEFLWPLVVLNKSEVYTLPVGLSAFQGELQVRWNYVLAMTMVTLLPVTAVFAFLQRFIATGIANTGMK